MTNEERMHKLTNGSDTAKWAHDEIVSLREQLEELNNEYLILYELACEVWPITNSPLSIVLSVREQAEEL